MDFQPMSPDEMQRTMQFLLNHQAKFTVDLDKMTVNFEALSKKFESLTDKVDRLADSMIGVTSILGQLIRAQETTNQSVDRLHGVFVQHLRRDHGYTDV